MTRKNLPPRYTKQIQYDILYAMKLDPDSSKPLADQMYDFLRNAIATQRYAPGDVLPSLADLAASAGVSSNVSRRALARLARDGIVVSRRGVGATVTDRRADANCRGRILCCAPFATSSAYYDRLTLALRQTLTRKGYLLETVSSTSIRADSPNRLREMLLHAWDLVLFWDSPDLRKLIASTRTPHIILGDRPSSSHAPNAVGRILIKNGKDIPRFIQACHRARVSSVVQFRFASDQTDPSDLFRLAEIDIRTVCLPRPRDGESCARAGLAAMQDFLKSAKRLPDALYLADDCLAQGALVALAQRGMRLPQDVRVVTLANKGIGPVWSVPLTRLESDPTAHGREISAALLAYFRTGIFPETTIGANWKDGSTF